MEPSSSESLLSSTPLTKHQRYRLRKRAIETGINPDLVAPPVKIGRPRVAKPSPSTLSQRRSFLRKQASKVGIDIPKLRPGPKQNPNMDFINSLMGISKPTPQTEEERLHSELDEVFKAKLKNNEVASELETRESQRRLLATQNQGVMAATALELEKQATADAKARKARTDDLVETYNDWKESAKKAKKPRLSPLDNNATSAAVVPPSPKDIDYKSKDDILAKTTVELVWALEEGDGFFGLVRGCWELGMFKEAANPKYKGETLDVDVLLAMGERLNKDDPERADFYIDDYDNDCDIAGDLHEYMDGVAADCEAAKKTRRSAKKRRA